MRDINSSFEYQVGGSLNSNAPSYVIRDADSVFYEALKAQKFCYVFNSRQMGKSSLRVRTMQKLQAEGIVCVFIDLMGMGVQDVTAEQWYAGIVQSLVSSCGLSLSSQWRTWWREQRDLLSPVQRMRLFVQEILLVEVKQDIVIFVDEIDQVLSQNFCLDDFFRLIRFFWEQRNVYPDYQRLTFSLLGVATPSSLIQGNIQTPFNIGEAIELYGFQLHEVQPLIKGLQGKVNYPPEVLQAILDWTGGQPFLTQKLCHLVRREVEKGRIDNPKSAPQSVQLVEQVVKAYIIENWEANDEPEHLRTIRDRILKNERRVSRLLGLYQKICQQGAILFDNSLEQRELQLSGLVVKQRSTLRVYNRIYATIFDQKWVDYHLNALRPYAMAIAGWLVSQDESFLLQGNTLQDALTWSLGKSLSDADYQFLGASQDLAKQQAQSALEILEQASHLLATARRKARLEVLESRLQWQWIPKIALGVTIFVLVLQMSGLLQGLEWNLLDQFFRWRSLEGLDERIVLVTIDESDITHIGHWPLSDRLLTQAIANIQAQNPQAIGLDLYRDLPVEPGSQALTQLFQSTPNLFGIEKIIKPTIAPHPLLKRQQQVGFADQVLDSDGKVRRALLSVLLSEDEVRYSFAVKLALHYLTARGVTFKADDHNPQRLNLGKAIFQRFEGNQGGYVRAESGGYQILLNFRGNQAIFPTFSLQNVLDNQIPANFFSSRLVLIGTTAESLRDEFYTPYSSRWFESPQTMPGVVVHANILSQILSAALEERPLLGTWSKPIEWLSILLAALLGAGISWFVKSSQAIAIGILTMSGGLLLLSYFAFEQGLWLTIIPSLLAFLGAAAILRFVTNKQQDRLLLERTLGWLLNFRQNYPTAGRIAIEYLNQSESRENQAFIQQRF